jgi:hypothetical protein
MIVKILQKAQGFQGVRYNTNKVELDQGELMLVKNFEALQAIGLLKPSDYVNYLKAVVKKNQLIGSPQFHAVISCKHREKSKEELTELAQKWLDQMGYGENPYLLIFHKDTKNNHVHIVSSRVDKQGRLVDYGFNYIKATEVLNKLTGYDDLLEAEKDLALAFAYQFSSRQQFELIVQSLGYSCAQREGQLLLYRFGRRLTGVEFSKIDERIAAFEHHPQRQLAIRIIIDAHKKMLDPKVYKQRSFFRLPSRQRVFTSTLAAALHQRQGIQFFFHAKPGAELPTDFTIIDHASARAFSSIEIMTFDELVMPAGPMSVQANSFLTAQGAASTGIGQQGWTALHIDITDDVDDEAVYGKNRQRKSKDKSKEITR